MQAISRKAVLRTGFGVVLTLLVFSTVEAYRIQSTVANRHLEAYKRYVEQEQALSELLHNVLLASTESRDYFLSKRPDREQVYRKRLRDLGASNQQALRRLVVLPGTPARSPGLQDVLEDYWATLERVPDVGPVSAYDHVQREIVPRRTAVYDALRDWTDRHQAVLSRHESEIAASRNAAVRRLFVLLGVCVVLGIVVAWVTRRYSDALERQATRQYQELAAARRDLQELAARQLEIQEEERRRLSRGLHDEIGQTLTALRMEISHALAKSVVSEVGERMERARALADRCVRTVRDISVLLRPAMLDDLGLAPALQWQVEEFTRRSGIQADLAEEGVEDALPDPVKISVYRVVQEALNNCEKHAGASRVQVALRQEPAALTLEVRDNGCGFRLDAAGKPRGGLGLLGMRERVARLDGHFRLETAPGAGTTIAVRIPLAAARAVGMGA